MRFISLLLLSALLTAGNVEFTFRIIYLKPDNTEIVQKLNVFASELEKQLNNFRWELPHTDFEKIETGININIDKNTSLTGFTGMITLSSGPVNEVRQFVPVRKNIYFNEKDINFTLEYENEPVLDRMSASHLETIVLFYAYLTMGENFDRLSYTDRPTFKLEGDFYYQKLNGFENILTSAADRNEWSKRIELLNNYRMDKNIELRRLNALMYNAVHFMNTGKKDRASYFVEPVFEQLTKTQDIPENFFTNNFYALSEIFSLSRDEKYFEYLISEDPERESYYKNKKDALKKPSEGK
ncbi:MAG: DUF4835 family protein [Candidatus Delongbacteria bacterium]|nr:DUF4835 family protein [Candidatus Delongbacteria bacterium]